MDGHEFLQLCAAVVRALVVSKDAIENFADGIRDNEENALKERQRGGCQPKKKGKGFVNDTVKRNLKEIVEREGGRERGREREREMSLPMTAQTKNRRE
jgi:hypothetical protein